MFEQKNVDHQIQILPAYKITSSYGHDRSYYINITKADQFTITHALHWPGKNFWIGRNLRNEKY